jgi:SAM-dependent methyltransferase
MERRETFDTIATEYDRVRPSFPLAVIDWLGNKSGVRPGETVLETGAGTGQATAALVERGYRVDCIEPGASMSTLLRSKFAQRGTVRVFESTFEQWEAQRMQRIRDIAASGFYDTPRVFEHEWDSTDSPELVCDAFRTHSSYLSLEKHVRDELDPELRDTFRSHDGDIRTRHVATVYLAKRR